MNNEIVVKPEPPRKPQSGKVCEVIISHLEAVRAESAEDATRLAQVITDAAVEFANTVGEFNDTMRQQTKLLCDKAEAFFRLHDESLRVLLDRNAAFMDATETQKEE